MWIPMTVYVFPHIFDLFTHPLLLLSSSGKGNEDKRGQPITLTTVDKSWLYLHGHPVICSRHMEVAAMVSSINPAINATMDSVEMGALQQDLLWLLYDMGDLDKYGQFLVKYCCSP